MTFTGELFPYQKEAFDRMVARPQMLLAYEQGTGKTVVTLAVCEQLMETGKIAAPVLVIALSSLKYQWSAEIEKFTDSTPLVIDGTPKQRQAQYSQARNWETSGVDYIIVNYEQVVNDWAEISSLQIGAIVADEATMLKGFRSKRSKAVKKLSSRVRVRFALSGTPIENGKPEEIYSIMQFVDPSVLGRFDLFDRTFIVRNNWGWVERYRNMPTLHKTMAKVMVRKRQTDPDVREHMPTLRRRPPFLVPFDTHSHRLYEHIRSDLLGLLDEAVETLGGSFNLDSHYGMAPSPNDPAGAMKGKIMAQITALRMTCAHPAMLRDSAADFHKMMEGGPAKGSAYAAELQGFGWLENVPSVPPKAKRVAKYIQDFLEIDPMHKVVVFTTFLGTVDMLHALIPASVTYSGRMNAKAKEAARQAFKTDPNVRVLISSDAGGYGVDLPEGNLLVNYDLPWKAGTAAQRDSRIIRASSDWDWVAVDNFLILDSIEERQYQMLEQKNRVASAIIDGQKINSKGGVDLTLGSLRRFLSGE